MVDGVLCSEAVGHKHPRHVLGYRGWQRHMEMAWEMPTRLAANPFPFSSSRCSPAAPIPSMQPQVLLLCLGPSWELCSSLIPNQSQTKHIIISLAHPNKDLSEPALL